MGEVTAKPGYGAVWGGGGPQLVLSLPSQRVWRAGTAKDQEQWMRDQGVWVKAVPHAMVAMQHAHAVGRQIGLEDLSLGERVWAKNARVRNGRVTAKAVPTS